MIGLDIGGAIARDTPLLDESSFYEGYNSPLAPDGVQIGIVPFTGNGGRTIYFAQKGISSKFRHGEFAGMAIDDVSSGLKNGTISPNQLPIKVVRRNGNYYTVNNRSLMALREAGLEPTVIEDVTGQAFFERQITERLQEIGSEVGPDFVPRIRGR